MDSFIIQGGTPLSGTIDISGSKNAALPILAACLMTDEPVRLHRVPRLNDIDSMIDLLSQLGCRVERHEPRTVNGVPIDGPLDVHVQEASCCEAAYDIVKTMRASICVLGPLLAKRGRAVVSIPGGCAIGDRPIDLHLRGLEKLGAVFHIENGHYIGTVRGRLKGTKLFLGGANGPTVLGTINIMSAAALAEGRTTLVGAACEPEVEDTARLLNAMGAKIYGAGSPTVVIEGVEKLHGAEHHVIADRIETGTFVMAAAITGGRLSIRGGSLDHLDAAVDRLTAAGLSINEHDGVIDTHLADLLQAVDFSTQPYPGFPTDLQAQMMALLCLADGLSVISERIYPDRFTHVGELTRMGARIRKEASTAVVGGVPRLQGATVMCSDLRASAALVLAGLAARGTTKLDRIYHIDRGYEQIEAKLAAVGANITRIDGNGNVRKLEASTFVEPKVIEPARA